MQEDDESTHFGERTLPADERPLLAGVDSPTEEDSVVEQDIGVTRIEALYRVFGSGKGKTPVWLFYSSIGLISFAYSLSSNTVGNFFSFATSAFGKHSILGTVEVAVSVLGAVSKPFIARLSDTTSRPTTYFISLVFYVLGFIVVASARSVNALAAGELLYTIGNTGIDLVTHILMADISPLKWRGFMTALPASPYIINAFIAGYIVDGLGEDNWRWGYGMFAIIMPVVMAPALMVLFWADIKAKQLGVLSIAASSYQRRLDYKEERLTWWKLTRNWWVQIDAVGLILLGIGWGFVLLPFTLYKSVEGGWRNDFIISMLGVGCLLLVFFVIYEIKWAEHPLMPARVLNRTFLCCVTIDVFNLITGTLRGTFFPSWVYVVKDWSVQNWVFFNNSSTVGLCIFALLAGVIQRATHRYKALQIFGLGIKIVAVGLLFYARGENATGFLLVSIQLLIALGGAFVIISSRVGTQASVPHQDLATVIALLALWAGIGSAIGSAIATAIWNENMPRNLNKYLGDKLSAEEILKIFGSIRTARTSPPEIRAGVIKAYDDTMYLMYVPAEILCFIPFVIAFFTKDFFLGDTHNAVEGKKVIPDSQDDLVTPDDQETVGDQATPVDDQGPSVERGYGGK